MLNTKDIKGGGGDSTPKTLQPGNQKITIHRVELEDFKFKPGGLHVILHVEGEDMGEEFQGFFIDKQNESLGRYKGQVGRVRASEWAYADGETKSGIPVSRDDDMLRFLKSLCIELDCLDWLENEDGKHPTIQSLYEAFNNQKPFKGKWLNVCLAGKEYNNKEGYTNYDLFFPKFSKAGVPFENVNKGASKVVTFNPDQHIVRKKNEEVKDFGNDGGAGDSASSGFKL